MNNTYLSRNSAINGGAINFNGAAALIENITLKDNTADEVGGAACFTHWSGVKIVNATFQNSFASFGGAIRVEDSSMLHCIHCNMTKNLAYSGGGAISIISNPIKAQPVAFQCDNCHIKANRATLGGKICNLDEKRRISFLGGIYHYHMTKEKSQNRSKLVMALRGVNLIDNYADVGGGGLIVSHPQNVAFSCLKQNVERNENDTIVGGFLKMNETNGFRRLSKSSCRSWPGNKIGDGGYGSLRATFVTIAFVCLIDSECRFSANRIPFHRSAEFIPAIKITLVGGFG